jgi:sarcosine reductase
MKLELLIHDISDVKLVKKTAITEKVLYINVDELRELLQRDKRLDKVDIELAHPGEKCRILQVSDVVEPRAKIEEDIADFPGALGKQGSVGRGSTCVLRGVAVVMNDQSELTFPFEDQIGDIIDMTGPGGELSIYAKTHNVVVLTYPAHGVSPDDYRVAMKKAGLRAAVYLAQAGRELKPDKVETYDLPPLTEVAKGMENLPRVAYIFQLYMNQFMPLPGEPIFYGDSIRRLVPIVLHPNEVLDGAIVRPYRGGVDETYVIQNHPLILELYRRHGKDLCFVGVILTTSQMTEPDRERAAAVSANLAKSVLGAEGVVLTKSGGGAPEVDMGETADRCEELGMKTVLLMWQLHSADMGSALFNFPRVNAIASTGVASELIKVPPVESIIGRIVTLDSGATASGELKRMRWRIAGATDQLGYSKLVSALY